MENSILKKSCNRRKRTIRVRKNINGSADQPRMCVNKTNAHIHVQVIDDVKGVTLVSSSTIAKEFRNTEFGKKNKASARQIGLKIAEMLKAQNIKKVIFDRGPFKYHGVVAAVADGAREGGLEF